MILGCSTRIGSSHSSPNRAELRTFRLIFSLRHPKAQQQVKDRRRRPYRNPIALTREWQAALESGECSSGPDLARKLGISPARVSQVLRLLRLPPEVLDKIAALGNPMPGPIVTERELRRIVRLPPVERKQWIDASLPDSL
jgi:hypothetical protein